MKIGIIGIGYIGTIISAVLASRGHEIVGVDSPEENVKNLREGISHVHENGLDAPTDGSMNFDDTFYQLKK